VDALSDQNFVVVENFISNDLYQTVKDHFLFKLPSFSQAGIGALDQNTINKKIRGDATYWLTRNKDTNLQPFWELVDELLFVFNKFCYLSLKGYEFHFAKYPPGGHYDKHIDQFQDRNNRMISVVIYLNDEWQQGDGGELEIFNRDQSVKIEPRAGRCVLFKS
jgi:SM-20-related protein